MQKLLRKAVILMKINGERVSLSKITSDDLEFICDLECNNDIWFFEEYVESDKRVVREKYLEKIDSKYSYDFIIEKIIDGKVIPVGLAQIWSYIEHRRSWELGFAVLPDYQGHGHGYDATKLLLEFAFNNLGSHKIVGMRNCINQKSIQLMEKLGMRREGIFKEELFWRNQWYDQYFYSILEREYQNSETFPSNS
jgi:[ribosomal protein S5]-alanine N-acetyltransferase